MFTYCSLYSLLFSAHKSWQLVLTWEEILLWIIKVWIELFTSEISLIICSWNSCLFSRINITLKKYSQEEISQKLQGFKFWQLTILKISLQVVGKIFCKGLLRFHILLNNIGLYYVMAKVSLTLKWKKDMESWTEWTANYECIPD